VRSGIRNDFYRTGTTAILVEIFHVTICAAMKKGKISSCCAVFFYMSSKSVASSFQLAARETSLPFHRMKSNLIQDLSSMESLKVLALHGSEGTGLEFSVRLYPLREVLLENNIDMRINAISAPFRKGHGYAWWTMEEGKRSFNANEYIGFQESADRVVREFASSPPQLVIAHSQGAILVASLLAQNLIQNHPSVGYILNGAAWPNPFGEKLFELKLKNETKPRILFTMGKMDTINPLKSANQVRDCLQISGFEISTILHEGGHSLPSDERSTSAIVTWIKNGV
jgi:predicted esterase